ncbi:hypothetical protein D9757_004942 [Collybiopsis confluens]|uniref:Uncharacterized protein n=1 Tax=Collybiopsis confluens TaxID=2823264 RepID=A0A8H5MCQ0_9AGAR|nr:hypothetical protein D9757_004942 [Collybiopsis confluens]
MTSLEAYERYRPLRALRLWDIFLNGLAGYFGSKGIFGNVVQRLMNFATLFRGRVMCSFGNEMEVVSCSLLKVRRPFSTVGLTNSNSPSANADPKLICYSVPLTGSRAPSPSEYLARNSQ